MSDDTSLQIPACIIPVPQSLSPQAQAFLAGAAKRIAKNARTSANGTGDQSEQEALALQFLRPAAEKFRGSEMCRLLAKIRASDYGVTTYAVDYRLLPDHPYPAALDDCMASYREILKHVAASRLVVGGASVGANLAAAMLLRARDEGLPLPAALILQTPLLDLTEAGDSYRTNRFLDVNLYGGAGDLPNRYAVVADKTHPYLSPLFGDFMGTAPEDFEVIGECKRFMYHAWETASS
jgi:monoterpene epsilon-lactone hydrolase